MKMMVVGNVDEVLVILLVGDDICVLFIDIDMFGMMDGVVFVMLVYWCWLYI